MSEQLAIDDLARSGISPDDADRAGMFPVDDAREAHQDFKPLPALVIPYYDPLTGDSMICGKGEPFCRIRYLAEPPARSVGFVKKKAQRYAQPAASGVHPYFPVTDKVNWPEVFNDPEIPVIITEGEKKALRACLAGVPCVGLGGVFNFMANDSLLPRLADLACEGRDFYICFDSDAELNPDIQAAEGRLATELSLKRGARVFLVRIPTRKPKKGEKRADVPKVGLDDYIVAEGEEAFLKLLEGAQQMRKVDSAVLGLNASVAWIEGEGMVIDTESLGFIRKGDFVSGSKYSALEVQVPTLKGTGMKRLSVAQEWLTHPHAQRFHAVVFNPDSQDRIIADEQGRPCLNLWRGWDPEDGDVTPFLELSEFLFSELPEEQRGLPLKLMAYKAQNPGLKVPMALVLVGQQGCGKSLWARIVREAFAPYGVAIPSQALLSPFNGWVESSLICVIDEAQAVHLTKGADVLKSLISETRQNLNEKFRPARQVSSFTSYILTSNDRRAGSYSGDDRRMFVINTPNKREESFYDRVGKWLEDGGARSVLGWLLNYDLKGWRPAKTAPMTAEKYMAYMESLTPIQRIAEEMKTANEHVIKAWVDASLEWARINELENNASLAARARDIKEALSRLQIRPFYTPEELAMMFPAIAAQMHGAKSLNGTPAGEISRQLRESGIPYLTCSDDPRGFRWRGMLRQYLIVAEPEEWRAPMSQNEFERAMSRFPDYGTFCAMSLDSKRQRATKKQPKE